MTASERLLQKALVGSGIGSGEWNFIQAALRDRAFFSARVSSIRLLDAMRAKVAESLRGNLSVSDFRLAIRRELDATGYDPGENRGTLKDLTKSARLDLIYNTNREMAQGFMQHLQATSEGALAAAPAYELMRAERRRVPRNWPEIWKAKGGTLYDGRMIALKTDPIWTRISRFGLPHPPFDYNSGMDVFSVSRRECLRLGVIDEDSPRQKPPHTGFNANLRATLPKITDKDWAKLKEAFGDQIQRRGDTVAWRTDWLKDAFDGGNFTIRLGKAQGGLLSKLPRGCEFNGWQNGQLTVDQTWLDNKRDDGTDHRSHFRGYGNDAAPLEKGDIDLLPCLWRNPDRAWLDTRKGREGRHGIPWLVLELDALDGNIFRAVVDIGTARPFLKTFFKRDPVGSAALIQARAGGKPPA